MEFIIEEGVEGVTGKCNKREREEGKEKRVTTLSYSSESTVIRKFLFFREMKRTGISHT